MTNDNFTEAARAEAEQRYNRIVRRNKTADEWLDEGRASAFTSGAEWARTRLAAQESTGAEVGAVQKCLYERTLTWVPAGEVRAALSAARAARRGGEAR